MILYNTIIIDLITQSASNGIRLKKKKRFPSLILPDRKNRCAGSATGALNDRLKFKSSLFVVILNYLEIS